MTPDPRAHRQDVECREMMERLVRRAIEHYRFRALRRTGSDGSPGGSITATDPHDGEDVPSRWSWTGARLLPAPESRAFFGCAVAVYLLVTAVVLAASLRLSDGH